MAGPGEYPPDATEGVVRLEDLPAPKVVRRSRNCGKRPCPSCGHGAYRNRTQTRTLHDVGDPVSERPREIRLTVSQHHCTRCGRYFLADSLDLAPPGSHYTNRVIAKAVRLVAEDGRQRDGDQHRLDDKSAGTGPHLRLLPSGRRARMRSRGSAVSRPSMIADPPPHGQSRCGGPRRSRRPRRRTGRTR